MTISPSELPLDLFIQTFLDHRHNWHPGEIQTLTGYGEDEYVRLKERQATNGHAYSKQDLMMLRQAASTLLALPTTSQEACQQFLGSDWATSLRCFLEWQVK